MNVISSLGRFKQIAKKYQGRRNAGTSIIVVHQIGNKKEWKRLSNNGFTYRWEKLKKKRRRKEGGEYGVVEEENKKTKKEGEDKAEEEEEGEQISKVEEIHDVRKAEGIMKLLVKVNHTAAKVNLK